MYFAVEEGDRIHEGAGCPCLPQVQKRPNFGPGLKFKFSKMKDWIL